MFIAIDSNGNRTDSNEANKETKYFCPICGEDVKLKKGKINAPHFAHQNGACSDNWNYDMSWWHRKMQNYFSQEYREIIVTHNNRRHRADILIDNIVIEFQHSPISISEFNDRNCFFKEAGYRLAWIFDLSEQYESENIYCHEQRDLDYLMHWKHPKKIFSNIQYLSDSNKNFVLWFAYNDEDSDLLLLDKVIWTPINEYGERIMNRFMVSQYIKTMDYGFNPQELFYTKEDNFKMILNKTKSKYYFKIKYKGVKNEKNIQKNHFTHTCAFACIFSILCSGVGRSL